MLLKHLTISSGIFFFKEKIQQIAIFDTVQIANTQAKYSNFHFIRNYICQFIQIPLGLNTKIPDNFKKRSFTKLEFGINFNFIYYENNSYGTEELLNNDGYVISRRELNSKERKNKYSFTKITPYIYIGREHFNKKRNFSMSYGSSFGFKSIYQKHNTAEFIKNYSISPIILGIAYHF